MKGVKKADLPTKVCVHCNRPFTWRKKWEKVWDEVKYCSDKCRKADDCYFNGSLLKLQLFNAVILSVR